MKYLLLFVVIPACFAQGFQSQFEMVFNGVDTNHNQKIDLPEFEAIFDRDDLDHNNQVTLAEYLKAEGGVGQGPVVMFKMFDHNHDGVISRAEVANILHMFDLDNDGTVTKAEFIKEYSMILQKISQMHGHHIVG